jgi:hypothetical protein
MGCERDPDQQFEFIVEKLESGGYLARSFGACIVTEGETLEELKQEICDAVCCHFDEGCTPTAVKLRFVEVVREEVIDEVTKE